MKDIRKEPVDLWIIDPIKRFMSNSTTSGIMLFSSALLAMVLANSPWSEDFHHLWEIDFGFSFNGIEVNKSLHHWINDGLMAVFFFVVGLELKREIIAGELSEPRKALLPIVAALGGMLFPALIYVAFNYGSETISGWGIPMATDIAFALGVLYLLGDRVPVSLKVFLTALAITDDLGAVLVIALFYTSEIDYYSLLTGGGFLLVLITANILGVRNVIFYGVIGIGGLWLAFLMSDVHATIAAVLAAFTIPVNVRMDEKSYTTKISQLLVQFDKARPNNRPTVTNDQLHILEKIRVVSKHALTPLQRLEHSMHPLVAFVIMPIFALSNAGVAITSGFLNDLLSPVALGTALGLLLGKVIGVAGIVMLFLKMGWATLPEGMTKKHLLGAGFLAAIGFTMSLFIAGLAFNDPAFANQAKIGILVTSVFASFVGFFLIRNASQETKCY